MAEFPLTRRQALIGVTVALVLLVVGARLLRRPPPAAVRPPILPASTSTRPASAAVVIVDVVGAVRRPGLYRLRDGSRVADALVRAGGAARKADLAAVNLAAPIADGEQVVVPGRGAGGIVAAGASAGSAAPSSPVHLNTATLDQLDALPGVGPVTTELS